MSSLDQYHDAVLWRPQTLAQRYLPEGIQSIGDQRLCWVNIQSGPNAKNGSINVLDLKTKKLTNVPTPGRIGFAFATNVPNNFVIGCEDRIGTYDVEKQSWTELLCKITDRHGEAIINDACIFERGIIVGTKDQQVESPIAALYFVSFDDGAITKLLEGQTCSNGKVILKRGNSWILYDIDSPTKTIMQHELEIHGQQNVTAQIIQSKVHINLTDLDGCPDGMTMTPDKKSLVVAMYNGDENARDGQARQYNIESGILEYVYDFHGAPRVTCPAFFVRDSEVLLGVTTAVEADEHGATTLLKNSPNSGCVMFARTEFKDMPQIVQYDSPSRSLHEFPSQ